jgi:hypothetical protein
LSFEAWLRKIGFWSVPGLFSVLAGSALIGNWRHFAPVSCGSQEQSYVRQMRAARMHEGSLNGVGASSSPVHSRNSRLRTGDEDVPTPSCIGPEMRATGAGQNEGVGPTIVNLPALHCHATPFPMPFSSASRRLTPPRHHTSARHVKRIPNFTPSTLLAPRTSSRLNAFPQRSTLQRPSRSTFHPRPPPHGIHTHQSSLTNPRPRSSASQMSNFRFQIQSACLS